MSTYASTYATTYGLSAATLEAVAFALDDSRSTFALNRAEAIFALDDSRSTFALR